MTEGKVSIFKCNWISSYWKIEDFWREFGRTDVCFPQTKNTRLFPRNLNNNSKAVAQTSYAYVLFVGFFSVCCFFFGWLVFPTDGSYFYTNGEKSHSKISKWSNEVHSYQWNINGLQDKIVSYKSAQLYLKTVQKPSLLKCCLSASLLPFSHSLISLSIHFFHFC